MTTKEDFLRCVRLHHMKVLHDDGIYRHLRFASIGAHSWNQWFEIITWPGKLTLSGDMGTWVFARVEDMFQFFRGDELTINPDYWTEKLEAVDRVSRGVRVFNGETFRNALVESLDGYDLTAEERELIKSDLKSIEFSNHEHSVRSDIEDFRSGNAGEFRFTDTWEISGEEWVGRYLWCLYAIVWGIQQYDEAKREAPVA